VTVVAELRFGAMNAARAAANLQKIDDLISRCVVLDSTKETARIYAELRMQMKKPGRPIPQNDIWIAAACVQQGIPLATDDSHFDSLPGLTTVSF
jgi:tRNA(fMet)-specific endonuclease VapC